MARIIEGETRVPLMPPPLPRPIDDIETALEASESLLEWCKQVDAFAGKL